MMAKSVIESFVETWVARNVRFVADGNPLVVVDCLAAALTGDARAEGITGRDLFGVLGDIDDFLGSRYQLACHCHPPADR